jgi:DNA-binding MarR family transcriptional regulator
LARTLDAETRLLEAPHDHRDELRLWLRLLTCSTLVETSIRRRLRDRFETTLPRFDVLAQLERSPQGMTLSELSRRLMVSNGNITGLVERLVEDGLLTRTPLPEDRRVQMVALTPRGRADFSEMAEAHAGWISDMFQGLTPEDITLLLGLLKKLKGSLSESVQ